MAVPVSNARAPIVVADVIDGSSVGPLQVGLFVLCAICLILDGFDVQAIGYVAPAIVQEWGIQSSALGPVFGAGNFGVLVGSLVFTMVADKVGRRPVLVIATLFFSLLTILTARANTISELLFVRFVAGIGLGCIIPNATALIGEYSPRRLRVTLMATVSVSFTAGAAIGGFIAAALIPAFGWRSVFYVGGVLPMIAAVLMYFWLPESLQFLVLRGRHLDRVGGWLKRIDPHVRVDGATYRVVEENRAGVPAVHLFREGRGAGTVLLWVVNFMNIYNLYFLSNWLPTVVRGAGYPTSTAVLVGTTLQVGGTLGTFWLTWLIAKRGFIPILTTSFLVAAFSVALIGHPSLSLGLLFVVVFVAGTCVIGSQPMLNALSATYYPTYLRSTGIGWGLGIGRIGAIVGPVLGGEFLALKWSIESIFYVAAIPALITAIAMFALRWAMSAATTSGTAEAVATVHH
jgi:AAHS family 4-hydroxybenzoate transporter-like MFS transporter